MEAQILMYGEQVEPVQCVGGVVVQAVGNAVETCV
jgi:hypothetical protein